MSKIEINNIYKIFGPNPAQVLPMVEQGATKEQVMEETGHTVGLDNVSLSIKKGVALTSTSEFFEDLSKGKGPKNSILALGYAGWGPGQIEKEILANSWVTLSVDSTFLFDEEVTNKWNKAYNLLGVDPNKLSQYSGRA